MATRGSEVVRNAAYNVGAFCLSTGLALIATPYLIYHLNSERYGAYALLSGLLGYGAFMDFGFNQALVKYVSQFHSAKNHEKTNRLINSTLFAQGLLATVVAIGLFCYAEPVVGFFHVRESYHQDSVLGLRICAVGLLATILAETMVSALMGLQRYDQVSRLNVAIGTLTTLSVVALAGFGTGLGAMCYAMAGFRLVKLVAVCVMLKVEVPTWKMGSVLSKEALSVLASYGSYAYLVNLSGFARGYLVNLFVGAFFGPATVTIYVVAQKVVGVLGGALGSMSSVIFPYSSELAELGESSKLRHIYVETSAAIASLAIPGVLFFMLFAHELLEVWVGVNIADEGSALLRILSLAYLLSCLTMVPHYVSLGVGRVKVIAFFNLLTLLATLIVVPVSSYLSGVIGLGVGMLVVALLGPVFILYVNRRVVSVGTRSYVRAVFHNHTSMAVCFLVAAGGLKVVATVPGYARWGVASPVLLIVYYMASIASNRYLYQKLKDYSRSILRPSSPAGRPA